MTDLIGVDVEVLRQRIETLLRSTVFRLRTFHQPPRYLREIISQLCLEAGIDVDILRVDATASATRYTLVWHPSSGGPLEEQTFTFGRRGTAGLRLPSKRHA